MASFSSLHIGVSALNVSQAALNVTSHNLANVDTKGFVRQQTVITDFQYIKWGESHLSSMQRGLGANFAEVKQVRDTFLDQAYRQEIGRQAFYEAQYATINEIEGLFGELEGVQFQNTIKELWEALQELTREPDNIVARASFIQTAVSFVERADRIYSQMNDYQINLNTKILDQVNRINEIGNEIRELNIKIRHYESSGVEKANDLRDNRNLLLDELSEMVGITYKENAAGVVTVNVEGVPFVTEDTVYRMDTVPVNDNTQMLKPIWVAHGYVDVYNLDTPPSSMKNTDIGSLKGLLTARGHKQANYTDIPVRDRYETEKQYQDAVNVYNNVVNPSIMMTVQAQFDQLIHGIVTMINDTLCPNKEITLADDSKIWVLDEENAPVGMDTHKIMGEALFSRKSTPRYTDYQDVQIINAEGDIETISVRIYIEEDPTDNYTLYTLGEIEVNPNILQNNSYLPLSKNDGTGAYDIEMAQRLLANWKKPFATLSPNSLTLNNINEYYIAFISEIANRGEQMHTISLNQMSMVDSIDNKRTEVTGVSSDEELTNLIKFQHSFNAAARYINVVSEMLEHIIMRL
ncbi:MAG TPA: flagellar hook-associated protein FlgK [Clostridiales bacterium]|jgi:flagellar hook-associated protein 1 FlgK|nr:flagellar hook-associated protein FlgK [Clostridiales bacterium]